MALRGEHARSPRTPTTPNTPPTTHNMSPIPLHHLLYYAIHNSPTVPSFYLHYGRLQLATHPLTHYPFNSRPIFNLPPWIHLPSQFSSHGPRFATFLPSSARIVVIPDVFVLQTINFNLSQGCISSGFQVCALDMYAATLFEFYVYFKVLVVWDMWFLLYKRDDFVLYICSRKPELISVWLLIFGQ